MLNKPCDRAHCFVLRVSRVNRTKCCEAQQTSKGVYKAVLFYVEQTVTVNTVLFNVLTQMFSLVNC